MVNIKKLFIIIAVSLIFCGCVKNDANYEPPHVYHKDIDVVVESVQRQYWFATVPRYSVLVKVKSDEYGLEKEYSYYGSGAFGCPEQWNYNEGDIIKAELYSWVMDSTGEVVKREIGELY